jgi:arylsulfatase A-like enzyme
MNFQAVSTAQKLPVSAGAPGGYRADGVSPGPVLSSALDFVDAQVGSFTRELRAQHLQDTTTIVLSAKHGQSPTQPGALTRIDDGPILTGLDAAWQGAHPGAGKLVAHAADDAMLLWLTDRSPAATGFARAYLLARHAQGSDITGAPRAYTASGLTTVEAGRSAADFFGVRPGDPRVPDLLGITEHGVVYTGGKGKIAEHGGADPQDRHVPILVAGPHPEGHSTSDQPVNTTQIAPTILRLLGLDPDQLRAVQREHTQPLPLPDTARHEPW